MRQKRRRSVRSEDEFSLSPTNRMLQQMENAIQRIEKRIAQKVKVTVLE